MLNWEEEVAPALAKAGLGPQPVAVEPQRPQPDQVAMAPQAAAPAPVAAAKAGSPFDTEFKAPLLTVDFST